MTVLSDVAKTQIKRLAPKAKPLINKSNVQKINQGGLNNKNYLKSLGVKMSEVDETIVKAAEGLIPDSLRQKMAGLNPSEVQFGLLKNEGKDYGKVADMSLLKAAGILGTRLASINREYGKILGGLSQLKDLK